LKSNAFACAVRLLARREHGAHELTSKLQKKGYSGCEAQDAVLECQRLGLQRDQRFVENVSRARISQGYGPVRIRQELQQLHIDDELINDVLRQEQDNWLSYAMGVWKKKYKEQGELSYLVLQKQKQFLLYRGFSTDTITMLFSLEKNDIIS
jgi:regulatory protein